MTTEVRNGELVWCRGQMITVTEEEIAAAMLHGNPKKGRRIRSRSRDRIVENIALGKRIGTYRDWPRTKEEAE